MTVVVITPPDPIVSLAEAKKHLRVDDNDSDLLIQALIEAATEWLDGPGGWLGRAVGLQTLEVRRDAFCDLFDLPYPPIVSVTSVKYVDGDGAEQTLSTETYSLLTSRLSLAYGASWPSVRGDSEGVRIRYVAGYSLVPAPIRHAVLLVIGHLYEHRGASPADALDGAAGALLSPYRVYSL